MSCRILGSALQSSLFLLESGSSVCSPDIYKYDILYSVRLCSSSLKIYSVIYKSYSDISGSLKWIFSSSQDFFLLYLIKHDIRSRSKPQSVLETIMCESFVCFCHFVHIFFSLYRCTCIVCCIHNLVRRHSLLIKLSFKFIIICFCFVYIKDIFLWHLFQWEIHKKCC